MHEACRNVAHVHKHARVCVCVCVCVGGGGDFNLVIKVISTKG